MVGSFALRFGGFHQCFLLPRTSSCIRLVSALSIFIFSLIEPSLHEAWPYNVRLCTMPCRVHLGNASPMKLSDQNVNDGHTKVLRLVYFGLKLLLVMQIVRPVDFQLAMASIPTGKLYCCLMNDRIVLRWNSTVPQSLYFPLFIQV